MIAQTPTDLVISVILTILLYSVFGRFIVSSRITNNAVEVLLFGLLDVTTVKFADIIEIKKGSRFALGFWGFFAVSNLWGGTVFIRRRGWKPNVLVSTKNPDAFIEEVRNKMKPESINAK